MIEIVAPSCAHRVIDAVSSAADDDGPQQEFLERLAEHRVTAVDRVLRVAQQMGEAHLPSLGMAALAAVGVGDPHAGANIAKHLVRHACTAAGPDQVQRCLTP
ncbi:MAG: hypothetical protein WDN04_05045 [Rhodospirillales bacterium]